MRRTISILAVLVLIALAGCTMNQSPEARFAELKAQQAASTYHVSYDLSSGALSGEESQLLAEASIDTYNRRDRSKTVIRLSLLGQTVTVAEFRDGNRTVVCREGIVAGNDLSCELGEDERFDVTGQYMQPGKVQLNLSGRRTVAGRECQMFLARPNSSDIDTGAVDPENARIEICLDTGKGYPALLRINTTEESELAEDTDRNVLTLRATDHDDDVTGEDVTPPLPVIVSVSCTQGTVEITPLHVVDEATVEAGGTNRTAEVGARYTTTTVDIGHDILTAAGTVTVHTSAGSRTATCGTGSFFGQFD